MNAGMLLIPSVGDKICVNVTRPGCGCPQLSGYWGATRIFGGDHELIRAVLPMSCMLGGQERPGRAQGLFPSAAPVGVGGGKRRECVCEIEQRKQGNGGASVTRFPETQGERMEV